MTDDLDLTGAQQRAFEHAVEKATERATQNVAQVHRRRLIMQSAIVTAVVMAALGFLIISAVAKNSRDATRANSRFNCLLFTEVAADSGQFVLTQANLLKSQNLTQAKIAKLHSGALRSLFTDPETVKLSKHSNTVQRDTIHFWSNFLVPDLKRLANVNCEHLIN